MKKCLIILALALISMAAREKTLIVYYSYTNNVHNIITALSEQIDGDIVRIEPAEKGLDYAANNYAIGSQQISAIRSNPNDAASYPPIDPVNVNLADYDCIIIGAPLWWSNMAAPLQTFLFQNGAAMAGKKIGLIVSSASSGISGVEGDAKRLIPGGDFLTPSLWIRSSQTSNAPSLISDWLKAIKYGELSGIQSILTDQNLANYTIFTIGGKLIGRNLLTLQNLKRGLYIVNGQKIYLNN
ncbi:MAG: hypothetical protein K2H46_05290 [Muribaculaceae bacterium]|nr:hypothetical protein [Muribaculaceae bacterium]